MFDSLHAESLRLYATNPLAPRLLFSFFSRLSTTKHSNSSYALMKFQLFLNKFAMANQMLLIKVIFVIVPCLIGFLSPSFHHCRSRFQQSVPTIKHLINFIKKNYEIIISFSFTERTRDANKFACKANFRPSTLNCGAELCFWFRRRAAS